MTDAIVVVGSGASGVHFALSALRKGHRVLMLDVGHKRPEPPNPGDDFTSLKTNQKDPVEYFLGRKFEALILPGHEPEYYGFPPSKEYVFTKPGNFLYRANGFSPLVSFAAGGLAEAWTGGCYPFQERELIGFPFPYKDLAPWYSEVARRIGIAGTQDDLAKFMPLHDGLMEPLDLDEHSAVLLAAYEKRKQQLNEKFGCFLGRSRVAVLSRDLGNRKRCDYLGRCLWGCPSDALYTPSVTLEECRRHPNFEYQDNTYVSHFRYDSGGRITRLVATSLDTGQTHEIEVGRVVLAAGTLSSAKIFLESIYRDSGESLQLRGLMDNRQVLAPFVNLKLIGRRYEPKRYQYHQIALTIAAADPIESVHGLVTTLKTALIHPIVPGIPFDLGTGVYWFRNMRAALGLVNVNFSDHRRDENYLALEADPASAQTRLLVNYRPDSSEAARIREATRTLQKVLWKLGCLAPSAMMHIRPMGASVHYAGTIPMSADSATLTCTRSCQSRDFENLYFVDGTTFPVLPAKNLTFTLMANAVRVAEEAF
ncbi:MAG: GMC family oxidoreductase [Acidobacteria bacterium]|nr:GMC family oxidoreductase [Acidobacteriota bacterium]